MAYSNIERKSFDDVILALIAFGGTFLDHALDNLSEDRIISENLHTFHCSDLITRANGFCEEIVSREQMCDRTESAVIGISFYHVAYPSDICSYFLA